MELISVRELFKNTDAYVGKEVELGGWCVTVVPASSLALAS